MPFCGVCHELKLGTHVVLHEPPDPEGRLSVEGGRLQGHSVCQACAARVNVCPFCRAPKHVAPLLVEQNEHCCGQVFVFRTAVGLEGRFCGSPVGEADYCHHHGALPEQGTPAPYQQSQNYAQMPQQPQQHQRPPQAAGLIEQLLAEAGTVVNAELTATQVSAADRRVFRRAAIQFQRQFGADPQNAERLTNFIEQYRALHMMQSAVIDNSM